MGLGSDVALACEAEGRGFNPWLDAKFLPQHVDPPINWVVTWLWLIVKYLEFSQDVSDVIVFIIYLFILSDTCHVRCMMPRLDIIFI